MASLIQQAHDGLTVDPAGAEQLATRATALSPRNAQGTFVRAKARLSLGDCSGAACDFLRVTQLRPDHSPAAYLFLVLSLLMSSEYEAALETLENLSSVFSLEAEGMAEIAAEYRNKALAGRDGKRGSVENEDAWNRRNPAQGDIRELEEPAGLHRKAS